MTEHRIDPAVIVEQREAGWTDFHPEDYCHRCGNRNITWSVDSDRFNLAAKALGLAVTSIICIACFVEGHEKATGLSASWTLAPWTHFSPIVRDRGRPVKGREAEEIWWCETHGDVADDGVTDHCHIGRGRDEDELCHGVPARLLIGGPRMNDEPDRIDLTRELREAVGLFAGAMPITPKQAWTQAIAEVRRVREIATQGYCWVCEEKARTDMK